MTVQSNAFDLRLNMNQIAKLVMASGVDKTYIVEGPMGSGKSTMVETFRKQYGSRYNYAVVDCTQWDVGDVQIPDIDKAQQVVRFLPNVLLVGDSSKPMIVLLDEIGKASRPVQNALLPVMLERRVGAVKMPAGSIVFAATNLGGEGVGDLFQSHARNRVSFVEMRYPSVEEWINDFAIDAGVHPAVLAWADENHQIFQSFKDVPNPADNPYIFHPKDSRRSFVTPRSLYLASLELREDVRAQVNDHDATMAAIAGNIGARAAFDMLAFIQLSDKMASWDSITNAPALALIPENSPAAMCLTMYSAVARVDKATMPAVMTYIKRLPQEIQCMFATQLMRIKSKSAWAALNRDFTDWVRNNGWALRG
jgi:hypothetical protein